MDKNPRTLLKSGLQNNGGSLIITLFLTFLVTIAGFDKLSFSGGGITVRFSQLIYLLVFIYLLPKIRYDKNQLFWFLMLLACCIPSFFYSLYPMKSILYYFWLIYSYFVILGVFSYFTFRHRASMINAVLYSYRIQILAAAFLKYGGFQSRASLFYYEPSYFALSMILYVSIVIYNLANTKSKMNILDMFLLLAALIVTQSFTLLMILFLGGILYVLINRKIKAILYMAVTALIMSFVLIGYIQVNESSLLTRSIVGLNSSLANHQTLTYLIIRSGNRYPRSELAYRIFERHPIFGVGIGAYEYYVTDSLFEYKDSYNIDFLGDDPTKLPAANVYLELLSTIGLVGTFPFIIFLMSFLRSGRIVKKEAVEKACFMAMLMYLLMLSGESNYLRIYFWMFLGVYSGLHLFRKTVSGTGDLK